MFVNYSTKKEGNIYDFSEIDEPSINRKRFMLFLVIKTESILHVLKLIRLIFHQIRQVCTLKAARMSDERRPSHGLGAGHFIQSHRLLIVL